MENQGKQKVACTDTKIKMNKIDHELSKMVGLDALKIQLRKFLKGMLMDERRRAIGHDLGPRKLPHLAFLGHSGTGKSMVARMLGKLLHMIGILQKDKVTEVDLQNMARTPSLWLKRAAGGILLVHNCLEHLMTLSCSDSFEDSEDNLCAYSFAVEDIEEAIIPCMDSGKVVVIVVGCPKELDFLISKYVELRNRLSNIFNFGDYSSEELAKILQLKVSNNRLFHGFKLHSSCTIHALAKLIHEARFSKGCSGQNGHKVDKMLIKAKENLDSRIDVDSTDGDAWVTFTVDDFAAAATTALSENYN